MEQVVGKAKDYIYNRIESARLDVTSKISGSIANVAASFGVVFMGMFVVLMFSIALAFGLGGLLGKTWLGFLVVGLLYLLAAVILWKKRKSIIQAPVMKLMTSKMPGGNGKIDSMKEFEAAQDQLKKERVKLEEEIKEGLDQLRQSMNL